MKVSIVMPVYNCEKYLSESLNSVLQQTLEDWELICIDDGSTDNSLEILQHYQKKDSRIYVYTQPNQGAGVARNLGIQYAQGEYLAFLDADDYYIDKEGLNYMYTACKLNNVTACGSIMKLFRNGTIGDDIELQKVKKESTINKVLDYSQFQFDYGYCGFIYKTSLIKENRITFPSYKRFQDPPFFVKAMFYIQKFAFVDISFYCYRTPTVSTRFSTEKVIDLLKGLFDNLKFASENNLILLFEKTKQRLEIEYRDIICYNITPKSIEILELLLKINQLIQRVYRKKDYVISPLKKILDSVTVLKEKNREELILKMEKYRHIHIYGAGNATKDFLKYLQKKNLFRKVLGIIVTSKEGNPEQIEGIPVIAINDYKKDKDNLILITVTGIYKEEIICKLKEIGEFTYELVDSSWFCE